MQAGKQFVNKPVQLHGAFLPSDNENRAVSCSANVIIRGQIKIKLSKLFRTTKCSAQANGLATQDVINKI